MDDRWRRKRRCSSDCTHSDDDGVPSRETPAAKPSVQTVPAQTDTQVETPAPDPSASVPATPSAPAAATQKQPAANSQNSQPGAADNSVKSPKTPTKSQAKMMGDQLNAPTQIEKQAAEVAPPSMSFDAAGADGLGGSGANASVLNGHAQPVVKFVPPKPIAVSSGVATGMLIQRTPPVYPSIAKAARVGGTVELHATISKNGTIKDLHVVSGPPCCSRLPSMPCGTGATGRTCSTTSR